MKRLKKTAITSDEVINFANNVSLETFTKFFEEQIPEILYSVSDKVSMTDIIDGLLKDNKINAMDLMECFIKYSGCDMKDLIVSALSQGVITQEEIEAIM